jgi:hypothetical protein
MGPPLPGNTSLSASWYYPTGKPDWNIHVGLPLTNLKKNFMVSQNCGPVMLATVLRRLNWGFRQVDP